MVRRPVAWIVAVVLFVEALAIAGVLWFLGVLVDRQRMSLAGSDPDLMSVASKAGAVLLGLVVALAGVAALLVALRDRAPALWGRLLLIGVAVAHALLGAVAWGLMGTGQFVAMMVVLTLIVLLLMTYDRPGTAPGPSGEGADPEDPEGPRDAEDAEGPGDSGTVDLTKDAGAAPEARRDGGPAGDEAVTPRAASTTA